LQCGLLISLFLFSRYFVLSWRSPAFGIALGLGTFAIAELATTAIRLYVPASDETFDVAAMGIYHLCVLVWILYLVRVEREPRIDLQTLPKYDLEIWNRELERLLQ
jgi:tellurite resistance protein TehA-like permease